MKKFANASNPPQRYYGLHMYPGVAEYRENGKEPLRVYISEETIKRMNSTFEGRPVYVLHQDEVDFAKREDIDGYVIRSFYNAVDGKNWVEFLVVSDEGQKAIAKGWKLSNAYFQKETGPGGLCNGVEYQQEVTRGEYDHLAIVPNPRYEESVVLTPDEFKEYNAKKELELKKLANSMEVEPEGESSMLFFKRTKVENSADLENTMVTLPESKKDVSLKECVALADKLENMQGYANGDHMVKVGDDEMSVNEMTKKFMKMNAEMEEMKKKENKEFEDIPADEDGEDEAASEEKKLAKKENKKKNAKEDELTDEEKASAEAGKKFFNELANSEKVAKVDEEEIELRSNQIERGKSRYGSSK